MVRLYFILHTLKLHYPGVISNVRGEGVSCFLLLVIYLHYWHPVSETARHGRPCVKPETVSLIDYNINHFKVFRLQPPILPCMRFRFIRGDYKCFTVSLTAFGRQLHFPGQPWSGWTHLSAMWGKITPIYSTVLLPWLWLCRFFFRATFCDLSQSIIDSHHFNT